MFETRLLGYVTEVLSVPKVPIIRVYSPFG